jgi:hypothetical protein
MGQGLLKPGGLGRIRFDAQLRIDHQRQYKISLLQCQQVSPF